MKKSCVFLTLLAASLLVACGNKEEKAKEEKLPVSVVASQPSVAPATLNKAQDKNMPMMDGMPKMARAYNCTACHALDKKILGPAWKDVAIKYKGVPGAEAKLIAKVSKGGSGVWGLIPMPPNDQAGTRQAEIRELVQFILGLAK